MEEVLILFDEKGKKHAVPTDGPMSRVMGVGTLDVARLRAHVGRRISVGTKQFFVLAPSSRDLRDTMARGPQTLTPKDLGLILYECDVVSGSRVVEAGAGSGGLTVALARVVGPAGRVFSYDTERRSLQVAKTNVSRAGLLDRVEFGQSDVRDGISQEDVDAVALDLEDPWAAIEPAWKALRPCGHVAAFSPNMEQVKDTVRAMTRRPFIEIRTVELIEREMEVRDVGVRPSFAPLGHTGYLTFARKVLDTF